MKQTALLFLALAIALTASVGANAKTKRTTSKRSVSTQSVKRAYIKKVNNFIGYDGDGYFLTDITGDGIPELWIKYGSCEADYMLDVYTYSKSGMRRIMQAGAGHSCYYGYRNGKYVIAEMAHMGYQVLTRITYSGKRLLEKKIYESPGEVDNYKYVNEPSFDFIPFSNTSAINYSF